MRNQSQKPAVGWESPTAGARVEVGGEDIAAMGPSAKKSFLMTCRGDVNTFNEYVLRDEKTNAQVEQSALHYRMHETLDTEDNAIIMAHPESGKTNQVAIGRLLQTLGNHPELRCALLNNTQGAAKKTLSVIKRYIEGKAGPELHQVFPNLRPGEKWTEEFITIRKETTSKDYTIQTLGLNGDINGSRINILVVDDLLDYEATMSAGMRKKVSGWWNSSVETRLEDDAKVWFLTNAWHPEDLAHELEASGWVVLRFPVYDEHGRPTWPERWPVERIEKKRRRMTAIEFARMFLCKPRDDGAVVFQPEALELCRRKGQGYRLLRELPDYVLEVPGSVVVTGVDLAAGVKRLSGAVTCLFTLFVHPNGVRQPVSIRSGRWGAKMIFSQMQSVAEDFGGVMVVEDNGMQRHLVELAREAGLGLEDSMPVPIIPFTTGKNKVDPILGIENMAAEMENGSWLIPVGPGKVRGSTTIYTPEREIQAWLGELSAYDPAQHPGDRLMASWMANVYAKRQQRIIRRALSGRGGGVRARVLGSGRAQERAERSRRRRAA